MRAKELKFLRWKRRRQNRVCFEVFVGNESELMNKGLGE